ncbi:MAG: hypothetical protein ABI686_03455 [Acidobacteriota bacterium]
MKASTVNQLKENVPAPAVPDSGEEFAAKENEFQINSAMRSLLAALQTENKVIESDDEKTEKPRRVLLCLGKSAMSSQKRWLIAGFKVYLAQTPAQADERLREGKTEILVFSPDFSAECSGAAILQQKINSMNTTERRRLFFVSIEDGGTTMSAHEAFLQNLNLIVNTNDINQFPLVLNRSLRDFNEIYRFYN